MLICPNCNCRHENPDGSKYCSYCGTKLKERSICKNCGKELLPDSKFCPECGSATNKRQKTLEDQEKELENIDILLFKQNVLDQKDCIRGCFTEEDIILENIDKAFERYLNLAISGNSVAENAVGLFYEKGIYVNKDDNKALEWYERSAAHDCYYGYDNLACLYQYGMGCDKNIDKAISLYQVAANKGYAFSQFHLACIYYYEEKFQDYTKAFFWAKKAADQYDINGVLLLKEIYDKRVNDSSATKKIVDYLEHLSNKNKKACTELAFLYLDAEQGIKDTEKAEKLLLHSIELGNNDSYLSLGLLYLNGVLPDSGYRKTKKYLSIALEKGCYEAACFLGDMHAEGKGFQINYAKSRKLYELAAFHNITEAFYHLGLIYLNGKGVTKDTKKAIFYFNKSAEKNHVSSLFYLGFIFEHEIISDENLTKAIEYYSTAASLGDEPSMNALFYIYSQDEHKDEKLAFKYAELSSKRGNVYGYFNYAYSLEHGFSGVIDIEGAIAFYTKSYEGKIIDALFRLGYLYFLTNNFERSKKCLEQYISVYQENGTAFLYLGYIYECGLAGKRKEKKALQLYTKALELKEYIAANQLGLMYREGRLVTQNFKNSLFFFEIAANHGIHDATCNLGEMYEEGLGVEKNIHKAIQYYKKAGEEGSSLAYYNLGYIFYFGKNGIEKNEEISIDYLKKSSSMGLASASSFLCKIYTQNDTYDFDEALKYAELASQDGDNKGYIYIGNTYEYGYGCKIDYDKAIEYYKKAISDADENALICLASVYNKKKEFEISKSCLEQALCINPNSKEAYCILGKLYQEYNNLEKAREYYEVASSLGDKDALNNIGLMIMDEQGSDNLDLAERHIENANALNDDYIFLNNLGIIYLEKGQNNKATRFFQESIAKHESAEAYNNLGLMYLYGRGCDRNCIKAKHLFEKAIEIDNSAFAKYNLGLIYLGDYNIDQDLNTAKRLFEEAIEGGESIGYVGLGHIAELNIDKTTSEEEAKRYYKLAAKEDILIGYYHLATLYQTEGNYSEAKKCYEKAISKVLYEKDKILVNYAYLLEYCMKAANGYEEIIKYYKLAVQHNSNNIQAYGNLSRLFAEGHSQAIRINESNILSSSYTNFSEGNFDQVSVLNHITTKILND